MDSSGAPVGSTVDGAAEVEETAPVANESLLDILLDRLEGAGPPAHQVWLPPLAEPPTLDHIIPTTDQTRPYADPLAEEMAVHMIRNMKDFSLPLFDMSTGKQGIVHVIGPELGLSQPGMTIACGDSHTSTHGAVGAIAFGIGTTQVRDVLATQ